MQCNDVQVYRVHNGEIATTTILRGSIFLVTPAAVITCFFLFSRLVKLTALHALLWFILFWVLVRCMRDYSTRHTQSYYQLQSTDTVDTFRRFYVKIFVGVNISNCWFCWIGEWNCLHELGKKTTVPRIYLSIFENNNFKILQKIFLVSVERRPADATKTLIYMESLIWMILFGRVV